MMGRLVMISVFCLLALLAEAGLGAEQVMDPPNIDKVMSLKLAGIERAFSEFDRSKSLKKLAEIEKLNEDAGNALVDWWHSATALCCRLGIIEDLNSYRENEAKLNKHLNSLCGNSVKVADRYAGMKQKRKARTLYRYVTESFEKSTFGDCVRKAELGLGDVK